MRILGVFFPKISRGFIVLLIVFVGSTLQLGDLVMARYFIPLCTMILSLFTMLSFKVRFKRTYLMDYIRLHFIVLLFFVTLSFIGLSEMSELSFDLVKLSLAFGISLTVVLALSLVKKSTIIFVSKLALLSVLILFSIDALVRFRYFDLTYFMGNFYRYKLYSVFFFDTNALGLYGLLYFGFFLFLLRFYRIRSRFYSISLIFLYIFCILSFSRSVILALHLLLVYHLIHRIGRFAKLSLAFLLVTTIGVLSASIVEYVSNDGSGLSKILIYSDVLEKFENLSFRAVLFGHGINAGNYTFSYKQDHYAHALGPMLLGQFGILGVTGYLFYFWFLGKKVAFSNLYLVIPVFIAGLSYLHPFYETIFLVNGAIVGVRLNNSIHEDSRFFR